MPDYVLAVLLLNGSPGEPVQPVTAGELADLRPAIKKVARAWEIMDPREGYDTGIMSKPESFAWDVEQLRYRRQELRDAPAAWEADRLPPKAAVAAGRDFSTAFRRRLRERAALELDRAELFKAVDKEAADLEELSWMMSHATDTCFALEYRRGMMKKIRAAIGDEDWEAGRMPPYVPTWRFREE